MNLDILAIGAHPDDCELFMGGTLLSYISLNYKVGICDMTRGEASTYGSIKERQKELKQASKLLGLTFRKTFHFPDSLLEVNQETTQKLAELIRKTKPQLIYTFVEETRHPDHKAVSQITQKAHFLAGLKKAKLKGSPHKADAIIFFPEFKTFKKADFITDISTFFEKKIEVLKCYASQISNQESNNPSKTLIKSKLFWNTIKAKAEIDGLEIGAKYGESFFTNTTPKINNHLNLFKREIK